MIKITILVENTTEHRNLKAEHGLSLLIETEEKSLLFDTGQSSLLLQNAKAMGINLFDINTVVLSHCHYDHTGGIPALIKENSSLSIYTHPDIFRKCCAINKDKTYRNTGLTWNKELINNKGNFHFSKQPVQISKNIILTGEIPLTTEFEASPQGFYTGNDNNLIQDLMLDDQALIIKTSKGLIIILGCSHRGIINTIKQAIKITGIQKVHSVIGGIHLKNVNKVRLNKTTQVLKEFEIENIIPLHCTGFKPCAKIYEQIKASYIHACTGSIIEI